MESFDAFGGLEVQQPLTHGGEGGGGEYYTARLMCAGAVLLEARMGHLISFWEALAASYHHLALDSSAVRADSLLGRHAHHHAAGEAERKSHERDIFVSPQIDCGNSVLARSSLIQQGGS